LKLRAESLELRAFFGRVPSVIPYLIGNLKKVTIKTNKTGLK